MLKTDNVSFPPLENNDLVAHPPSTRPARPSRKKHGNRKSKRTDGLRDAHLNPVVVRAGTKGLNAESNPRVHLPPININLQVRDILSHDHAKQAEKQSRVSNFPTTTTKLKQPAFPQNKIENHLRMKEFSVLPPIGSKKRFSLESKEELETPDSLKTFEEDEKIGLQEALEIMSASPLPGTNNNNYDQSFMQYEETATESTLHTTVYLGTPTTAKRNSLKLHDINQVKEKIKLPKLPSEEMLNVPRRGRNAYQTCDLENEYERNMIEWCRYRGRRFAICQEVDVIYQDLAVIVKHNLLLQHLEEICMF